MDPQEKQCLKVSMQVRYGSIRSLHWLPNHTFVFIGQIIKNEIVHMGQTGEIIFRHQLQGHVQACEILYPDEVIFFESALNRIVFLKLSDYTFQYTPWATQRGRDKWKWWRYDLCVFSQTKYICVVESKNGISNHEQTMILSRLTYYRYNQAVDIHNVTFREEEYPQQTIKTIKINNHSKFMATCSNNNKRLISFSTYELDDQAKPFKNSYLIDFSGAYLTDLLQNFQPATTALLTKRILASLWEVKDTVFLICCRLVKQQLSTIKSDVKHQLFIGKAQSKNGNLDINLLEQAIYKGKTFTYQTFGTPYYSCILMYTEAEVAVGAIANSSYRLLKKAEKRVNYPRYGIPNFPIEDNNSLLIEYEFNCESKTLNYNINNVLITHLRAFYPDLRVVSICFMIQLIGEDADEDLLREITQLIDYDSE